MTGGIVGDELDGICVVADIANESTVFNQKIVDVDAVDDGSNSLAGVYIEK